MSLSLLFWKAVIYMYFTIFNPWKDFLDIFGQSGAMAQRACKTIGPFIWSWICHFNLFFSANLDLSLVYELDTLVFVTADLVDSIISISAGLAAVVLRQTLGPVDFFEWSHEEAVVAPCLLQPVEGCHHCCRPRSDLVNLPLLLLFKALSGKTFTTLRADFVWLPSSCQISLFVLPLLLV